MASIINRNLDFKIVQDPQDQLEVSYYSDVIEIKQGEQFVLIDRQRFDQIAAAISQRKNKVVKIQAA